MIVSNLIRPRFACFREIQQLHACPAHPYSFIFAPAATRYNNLIVLSRSLRSQLPPRPSLYRPHSKTESRLPVVFPEQRAVPTREVHLWRHAAEEVAAKRAEEETVAKRATIGAARDAAPGLMAPALPAWVKQGNQGDGW